MPKLTLCLDENKKLDGISQTDKKRYAKFKFIVSNLGEDSISFSYHLPRSGAYHRRFFAQLAAVFEGQEVFDDLDMFRLWSEVGAGHVIYYPMMDTGEMIAVPKSIAYDKLDQDEFQKVHDSIFTFLRSERARSFLWPHLANDQSGNMIESLLGEFE